MEPTIHQKNIYHHQAAYALVTAARGLLVCTPLLVSLAVTVAAKKRL